MSKTSTASSTLKNLENKRDKSKQHILNHINSAIALLEHVKEELHVFNMVDPNLLENEFIQDLNNLHIVAKDFLEQRNAVIDKKAFLNEVKRQSK